MVELKVTTGTNQQLEEMLQILKKFLTDIRMQFRVDECCILNVIKGK